MKRKVILHGPSTLSISLPSMWAKKFSITKGDEINLEERGKELWISTNKISDLKRKKIDIKDFKRLGKSCITSSYRDGYDEIELLFEDSDYIKTIQDIISKEIIGFEIVQQGANFCLIKDLTNQRDEFDTILRRIWALVLDLSEESLNAIKKKDAKKLRNIKLMDYSINKFTNYCLRLLNKKGHTDFKKTPLYFYFAKRLEEIADKYKDMDSFFSENLKDIEINLIKLLTELNKILKELYGVFYNYNEQCLEKLFLETKIILNKILKSKTKIVYISSICEDIKNLLSATVEIKI